MILRVPHVAHAARAPAVAEVDQVHHHTLPLPLADERLQRRLVLLGLLELADVAAADELAHEQTRYAVEHAVAVGVRGVLPDVARPDGPAVCDANGRLELADGHAASHGAEREHVHGSGWASSERLALAVRALDERDEHGPGVRLIRRHLVRLLHAPVRARLELVVQPLRLSGVALRHLLGDPHVAGALVEQVDVLLVAVSIPAASAFGRAYVVVQPFGEGQLRQLLVRPRIDRCKRAYVAVSKDGQCCSEALHAVERRCVGPWLSSSVADCGRSERRRCGWPVERGEECGAEGRDDGGCGGGGGGCGGGGGG